MTDIQILFHQEDITSMEDSFPLRPWSLVQGSLSSQFAVSLTEKEQCPFSI